MKTLVLATSNPGKIKELKPLFYSPLFKVMTQDKFGVPDAPEIGLTFIENAFIKARNACLKTGLPAIAEDSGLIVPALDGAPGLYSARYAGEGCSTSDNIALLLENMVSLSEAKRRAYFLCTLVYLRHVNDPYPIVSLGEWHGKILHAPKGSNGFGYDPVFLPNGVTNSSAAQLNQDVKSTVSHRAIALKDLISKIERELITSKRIKAQDCSS